MSYDDFDNMENEVEEELILINNKPLQIGDFDTYHYVMPDKRYFDVAQVLVIELGYVCVVVKNVGMRGPDKRYRIVDGKKVPLSELEFVRTGVDQCDLNMPIPGKFTGKNVLFDARKREKMLFRHIDYQ